MLLVVCSQQLQTSQIGDQLYINTSGVPYEVNEWPRLYPTSEAQAADRKDYWWETIVDNAMNGLTSRTSY